MRAHVNHGRAPEPGRADCLKLALAADLPPLQVLTRLRLSLMDCSL